MRCDPYAHAPWPVAAEDERARVDAIAVACRRASGQLPVEAFAARAARILKEHGVVVLAGLFEAGACDAVADAALADFEDCRVALERRFGRDLAAGDETRNFRELSMREGRRRGRRGRRDQCRAAMRCAAHECARAAHDGRREAAVQPHRAARLAFRLPPAQHPKQR